MQTLDEVEVDRKKLHKLVDLMNGQQLRLVLSFVTELYSLA